MLKINFGHFINLSHARQIKYDKKDSPVVQITWSSDDRQIFQNQEAIAIINYLEENKNKQI